MGDNRFYFLIDKRRYFSLPLTPENAHSEQARPVAQHAEPDAGSHDTTHLGRRPYRVQIRCNARASAKRKPRVRNKPASPAALHDPLRDRRSQVLWAPSDVEPRPPPLTASGAFARPSHRFIGQRRRFATITALFRSPKQGYGHPGSAANIVRSHGIIALFVEIPSTRSCLNEFVIPTRHARKR